ncbi:MAG: CDP-diacylglycerol--serine O-phosphatidyltransferase [Sphingobacteriia bacterium]|nr:CDP-diacylglycerol--serine O-phosphatidyltransferase [Sphingobacteriia bacterium]
MLRKNIPNSVTLLNLLSGCISITLAFNDNLVLASLFIGIAAVFDFLDGMLARLLNARSPLGLQLDSLSDVVSFGVAPGIIVFQLMQISLNHSSFFNWNGIYPASAIAFLIPLFSALRLAKFNIDDRQTNSFIGLPTPANAIFFASFPLVLMQAEKDNQFWIIDFLQQYPTLLFLTVAFSALLISPLPLMAFKFKNYHLNNNLNRYIFLSFVVVLILTIRFYALPLIIIFYIIISQVKFKTINK